MSTDVYLYDVATGALRVISRAPGGVQGNGNSTVPALSSDGRYVTYHSLATNLVRGDTNKHEDVFRYDRTTGATTRVSVTTRGKQIALGATHGAISADGNHVQFDSYGRGITKHAAGPGSRNTYVRDLTGTWPGLTARVTKVPRKAKVLKKAKKKRTATIKTRDIVKGEKLQVRWVPRGKTKGKAVTRTVKVKKNKFKVKAPARAGKYTVRISYDKVLLRKAVIRLS